MSTLSGTHSETDAQLVGRMRSGDVSAFETIVERHRAVVVARANVRLGSLADAEDVAQEAFVQAYFHEDPVPPDRLESMASAGSDGDGPAEADGIGGLLAELPETMREAVSLTFLAGYTYAEAARIMGVREGTVKSRVSRARARLREVLEMSERDVAGGGPTGEFTRRTIERLKREARRLVAAGKVEEARERAQAVIKEQVKPLYGDPEKLGVAGTYLAAYDSPAFKPDQEAVAMLGLPLKDRRRKECEANARQYGFELADLDWQVADVDVMSGTLGKPTGHGNDIWGVPISRMQLDVIDARELCQRLRVSPITLHEWLKRGCPILRCWPFARFDADRVKNWLAENSVNDWPRENHYELERPIRVLFREVYEGRMTAMKAEEVMRELGWGVWWAPGLPEGGW
jgi:DNA-directed RNA polymerase specialized sigma24 family protein